MLKDQDWIEKVDINKL